MERNLFAVTHGLLLSRCDGEHATCFEAVALKHQRDYKDFVGAKTFLAGYWSNQLFEHGLSAEGSLAYMHLMTCRNGVEYERQLTEYVLPILNERNLSISSP